MLVSCCVPCLGASRSLNPHLVSPSLTLSSPHTFPLYWLPTHTHSHSFCIVRWRLDKFMLKAEMRLKFSAASSGIATKFWPKGHLRRISTGHQKPVSRPANHSAATGRNFILFNLTLFFSPGACLAPNPNENTGNERTKETRF